MFQRILVLMLLITVELSTVLNCVTSFKPNIEVQDIEDCNENEDVTKDNLIEKFLLSAPSFMFNVNDFLAKNIVFDSVTINFSNPFQTIDSPPPKF
jgi:hypothetical protein